MDYVTIATCLCSRPIQIELYLVKREFNHGIHVHVLCTLRGSFRKFFKRGGGNSDVLRKIRRGDGLFG